MKLLQASSAFVVVCAVGLFVSGCKDPNSIENQMAAAKKLPTPSAEQMNKGWAQMAANQQKSKDDQAKWASTHTPEQVAEVNRQRAVAGKPPLGQ